MPLRYKPLPNWRGPREIEINWAGWNGGWNKFAREVEVRGNELVEAKNLMLIGKGIPTKRWGSQDYFLSGATGYGRGFGVFTEKSGTEEILAVTDWGYLTKKQGASYAMITGASFASGYFAEMAQLDNKVYIVNGSREMVKYDFSQLTSFVTIAKPAGLSATMLSSASGVRAQSWVVTAVSQVGETVASTPYSLVSLPQDLTDTVIKLQWTPVSAASGILRGYNIYRGLSGNEAFLSSVDADVTEYLDTGTDASLTRLRPSADTTGGPVAKYIIRHQDRLVLAGFPDDPTRVDISGRAPDNERFDWAGGGGYVLIDPDDGEPITGIESWRDSIIVFKGRRTFEIKLSIISIGNYAVLEPVYRLLTASQGCSSHRSIVPVDNDIMFVNRRGINILGQEPRIQDTTLRVNEVSSKISPFFETLSETDITTCNACYVKGKYVVNFPESKKTVIFDKERFAFMGPWTTPFGISQAIDYVDSNNNEIMLVQDADDSFVTDFRDSYSDDKGEAILTRLKTRKEDFGAWELFKVIEDLYFQFRNVYGGLSVNVFTETRDGQSIIAKDFSLSAEASRTGWGIDQWGTAQWGTSNEDAQASSDELIRKAILNQTARTYQIEIETSGREDNYELLNIKSRSHAQGRGIEPADTWVIS